MIPAANTAPASSSGHAGQSTDPREVILARTEPGRRAPAPTPLSPELQLRCADLHPLACPEVLSAPRLSDLIALAREHGALMHGFTSAWYNPDRLASIAGAVTMSDTEFV